MATIRKRAGKWQVQIRRADSRHISKSFLVRKDAQTWARMMETKADRQDLPADARQLRQIALGDLVRRYLREVTPKKAGVFFENAVLTNFLRDPICSVRVSELRTEDFASYRDQRLKTIKATTLKRQLNPIRHLFEVARKDWGLPIRSNPVADLALKTTSDRRERRLRAGEFERLIDAANQFRNPLVPKIIRFAVATGMRRSEILAIKWKHLNVIDRSLVIPKTKNGHPRTIPLTKAALTVKKPLSSEELNYISSLLERDSLEEEDAELILAVMREHATKVEKKLDYIIQSFPNLMKSVFNFCSHVPDKDFLAAVLLKIAKSKDLQEFQLFWFAHILEANLMKTALASDLIDQLFNHPQATNISKAKILEMADNRFGLAELRDTLLRSGQSDWLSWSAAVGERALKPASRNHRLTYFSKASPMNYLVSSVVSQIE